ncbi:MAG: asparagine synthase-related protein [Flavobacteriales bacterium]
MLIDSLHFENNQSKTFYPSITFQVGKGNYHILGGEPVIHQLVKDFITSNKIEQFTPELSRKIFLDLPGHYAIVVLLANEVQVVTDPYAIIKLYGSVVDGRVLISESFYDFPKQNYTIDKQALKYFFLKSYTPSQHTFFNEIFKFKPCAFYRIVGGKITENKLYAQLGTRKIGGQKFQDEFYKLLLDSMLYYKKHFAKGTLFLSGGIDSSFLYKLLYKAGMGEWADLNVGKTVGIAKIKKTDNDYDIEYSQRLAAENNQKVGVIEYDFSGPQVTKDFTFLRDHLFSDYGLALGYMGYVRGANAENVIVNGQNADSILSFGLMGYPFYKNKRIHGLNGVFTRYFMFYGQKFRPTPLYFASKLLRKTYYSSAYKGCEIDFSDKNYMIGLGMQPRNQFYFPQDPAYNLIDQPQQLADWFDKNYVSALLPDHLDHHAASVLLYLNTFMQGSDNRCTVLSSMLQGRQIYMPYTNLTLIELMSDLDPDWHYAYYGKYPNVVVGKKIGMPDYILERSDPVDSENTSLVNQALIDNPVFSAFLNEALAKIDLKRYEGVLSADGLEKLRKAQSAPDSNTISFLIKVLWVDTLISKQTMQ